MECEIESCENCNSKGSIKMLTDEGKALKELRRIGNLRERHISPIRQTIIYNSEMIGKFYLGRFLKSTQLDLGW
jgi:hypothetical protein